MWRLIVKRTLKRIRYLFIGRYVWEYESCQDCGKCFRIAWTVSDDIWQKVMERDDDGGGSLCVDCFIERVARKNIKVFRADFLLNIFIPEQEESNA